VASLDLRSEQRQTRTLSPRLQHAVRLLQMSSLDFAAMVRDSLGQNPFLEAEEGDEGGSETTRRRRAQRSMRATPTRRPLTLPTPGCAPAKQTTATTAATGTCGRPTVVRACAAPTMARCRRST
jgi:DNA-directed RNA polymerase specialized sigma54-like protein